MRALTDKIRPRHCRTESAEVRSLNYPALVSAPSRGPSIGFLVGGIFMTLEELKRIFPTELCTRLCERRVTRWKS